MSQPGSDLSRNLRNRHIQLIAIGGTIGVGLFLGSARAIHNAGPGLLLAYALGGVAIFFIMRALGELLTYRPVAGSFATYAGEFCGPFAGFVTGWSYWFMWVVMAMAELTAIGIYVRYWFPNVPQWLPPLIALLALYGSNLLAVRVFGELEFWFALIKVVTIVALIIAGILIFYLGALLVIMAVVPWNQLSPSVSPFVFVFDKLGVPAAASIITVVVITAASSSCNSGLFSTGRMLWSLAQRGQAPRAFDALNARHVPAAGIHVSAAFMLLTVILNYLVPKEVFTWVTSITLIGTLWTWGIIMLSHRNYRRAVQAGRAVRELGGAGVPGRGQRPARARSGHPGGAVRGSGVVRGPRDRLPPLQAQLRLADAAGVRQCCRSEDAAALRQRLAATDQTAAVHHQSLSGDEAAGARGEQHRRAGDIIRLPEAAQRIGAREGSGAPRIRPQRLGETGADDAGRDAVDADVVRTPFDRQIARQLHVGRLGAAVGTEQRAAHEAAHRGDDDHRSVLALRHRRQRQVAQPQVAVQVGLDDLVEHLVGSLRGRPEVRVGGRIAHDDVDPAPFRDAGIDECLQLGLVPHVTGVRERRAAGGGDLRRGRLAALGLAARDDDARAVQRHLHRDRPADTAARAGNEGHLARQVEHAHVQRPRRQICRAFCPQHRRLANAPPLLESGVRSRIRAPRP